jgi:hypothetical protein
MTITANIPMSYQKSPHTRADAQPGHWTEKQQDDVGKHKKVRKLAKDREKNKHTKVCTQWFIFFVIRKGEKGQRRLVGQNEVVVRIQEQPHSHIPITNLKIDINIKNLFDLPQLVHALYSLVHW